MLIGGLKQVDNAGTPLLNPAAIKISAFSAANRILIHLADIVKEATTLGALVIPVLEELFRPRLMSPEAP